MEALHTTATPEELIEHSRRPPCVEDTLARLLLAVGAAMDVALASVNDNISVNRLYHGGLLLVDF
jgi:hypothetical protein